MRNSSDGNIDGENRVVSAKNVVDGNDDGQIRIVCAKNIVDGNDDGQNRTENRIASNENVVDGNIDGENRTAGDEDVILESSVHIVEDVVNKSSVEVDNILDSFMSSSGAEEENSDNDSAYNFVTGDTFDDNDGLFYLSVDPEVEEENVQSSSKTNDKEKKNTILTYIEFICWKR